MRTFHRSYAAITIFSVALLAAQGAHANITDDFARADGAALGNGWIEKNAQAFSLAGGTAAKQGQGFGYQDNVVYRPAAEDVRDVEASVELRPASADPGYPQVLVRIQSSTAAAPGSLDGYILYVNGSGTDAVLGRQRGNAFVVGLANLTISPGLNTSDRFRLRLRAVGDNPVQLSAFVERLNSGVWQVIGQAAANDAAPERIQLAGSVGFGGYLETTYSYDNFVRVNLGAANNPVPTTTGLSPASAAQGENGLTLTVSGTGFAGASIVRWNGSDRATTFVSSTVLEAQVTAADLANSGTASVTVFSPTPGGGLSNAQTFTITPTTTPNPVPTTSGLSPSSTTAGAPAFTLTVNGTGFASNALVRWNGSNRTTTFVSPTRLTAAITAADVSAPGTPSVTVFNPAPGGGLSNAQTFAINPAPPLNPVPTATALNPSSRTAGSAAFTLTVTGTNFVPGSIVRWNGANRTTTYVSATSLTAAITAADVQTAGTRAVTVFNPAPGGGTSAALTFTINNPVPTLGSMNPSTRAAGSGAFTLTVTGTSFVPGSIVRWNGANRSTTYVSATSLSAAITAADVQTAGTRPVRVFNPTPGGGQSAALTFTITSSGGGSGTPSLVSLAPLSTTIGSGPTVVTLTGSGYTTSSVVRWNGQPRTSTFVSATQLRVTLPSTDLTADSIGAITVGNGVDLSLPLSFFVLPAGDTLFFDGFNRGPAQTVGNGWIEKLPSAFEILANGTLWAGDTFPYDFHDAIVYRPLSESLLDVQTGVEFTRLAGGRFPQVHARIQGNTIGAADTLESYLLYVEDGIAPQGLAIAVQPPVPDMGECIIRIIEFPTLPQVGVRYRLRFEVRGTYPVQLTGIMERFNGGAWETFVSGSVIHDANTQDADYFCPYTSVPDPISTAGSFGLAKWWDPTDAYDNFYWRGIAPGTPVSNIPNLTSMTPTSTNAGSGTFTLSVNGANFNSGSTVRWNGASRTTTFLSGNQLQATIPASDVATAGSANVTVFNSGANGGVSPQSLTFTVNTPPPSTPGAQFNDTFSRPNSSVLGNGWIQKTPAAFTLDNNQVRKLAVGSGYRDNVVYRPGSENLLDTEVSTELRMFSANVGYPQLFARIQGGTAAISDTLDAYIVYFNDSTNQAILGRQNGSAFVTALATVNLTAPLTTTDTFRIRLRATGTTTVQLQAFVERLDSGTWTIIGQSTASDASAQRISTAGAAGFGGNTENSYAYDNFAVFSLAP